MFYYVEPKLNNPDLIASWPGIGNIGLIAIETLRAQTQAEDMGELESWEFFYPKKAIIKSGILEEMVFPSNKFYYKRLAHRDLLFFIGEEQPTSSGKMYAEGKKAYRMANMVLDVAEKFGCRRVYTSGAAVSLTHHELRPKVWTVTSAGELSRETRRCTNTVLMSEIEGRGEEGTITGLNGLLLGIAKKRGFESICLMGEVPDYLSGAPFPYPKASRAILEVLTRILEIDIDYTIIDEMSLQVDNIVDGIYSKLPLEIKEKIEQRKTIIQERSEFISEEDEKWLKDHIDEFFKKKGRGRGRPC